MTRAFEAECLVLIFLTVPIFGFGPDRHAEAAGCSGAAVTGAACCAAVNGAAPRPHRTATAARRNGQGDVAEKRSTIGFLEIFNANPRRPAAAPRGPPDWPDPRRRPGGVGGPPQPRHRAQPWPGSPWLRKLCAPYPAPLRARHSIASGAAREPCRPRRAPGAG